MYQHCIHKDKQMNKNFEQYLEFCQTEQQFDAVNALIECGSIRQAAIKLGKAMSTVHEQFAKVQKRERGVL